MIYYFAYASNLSIQQMTDRCPDSHYVENLNMPGWRFIYNEEHVASIIPDPLSNIWGAIFKISNNDECSLDKWEGLDVKKYKKIELGKFAGQPLITYIASNNRIGKPFNNYHRHILISAINRQLPSDYINQLKMWVPIGIKSPRYYINQDIDY